MAANRDSRSLNFHHTRQKDSTHSDYESNCDADCIGFPKHLKYGQCHDLMVNDKIDHRYVVRKYAALNLCVCAVRDVS